MAVATYQLPFSDDLGFCNILMTGLGGDGANMAGKLLFKIGCLQFGLDGGYDARYGSEKKGTATDVSVRFCRTGTPVRQSGPTSNPHFLVVFRDDLIEPLDLGRGLARRAVCIVNTRQQPEKVRPKLGLAEGRIVCLDASRIAGASGSRLNMPLLASLSHELGFPDDVIKTAVADQWPKAVQANLAAFSGALSEAIAENFSDHGRASPTKNPETRGPIGWQNMLNGGVIDALTHSTINRDNRIAGRGHVPRFDPAACNSCGICLTVCSDPGGLKWQGGQMKGIDELFCKGCMRCVEVCPDTKKGKALRIDYA